MTRSSSDGTAARRVLGMDMGATHLRAGLVAPDGTIAEPEHVALPADIAARRRLPARIAAAHAPLDGIGFAVAGTVVDGVVTWTANLGLDGFDAGAALRQHVSGPVVVLNDARATGAGEARLAARPDERLVLVITVGTGLGGAVVLDGAVLPGTGSGGEVGHVTLRADGPSCACGRAGCWELYCGGRALDRRAAHLFGAGHTAADLARAVDEGDPTAVSVLAAAAEDFRRGLDSVCAVLAPHLLVLGGGVIARGGAVATAYTTAVDGLRWGGGMRVVRSALGDAAGQIGVATLVHDLL